MPVKEFVPFDIKDPTLLVTIYNKDVREQRVVCHPWQIRHHQMFANPTFDYANQVNRIALVANNGSGKSALIVAPEAVWLCMRYVQAHAVVTSASGVQLDRQTGRAINHLCQQINALHGQKIWDLKYREYRNTVTGSVIDMYATDEPGKAEGYHHLVPGGMFAVFPDEAKSIPDNLFEPISRCNGMSHFCPISSPGKPSGLFYRFITSDRWKVLKVTAYDCPHIKKDEIEEAKEIYGEYSAFFRSAYLAEFTSDLEQVVITYESIKRILREPVEFINDKVRRAGVDISGGGDESVVSIWNGNQQIGLECFRFTDARKIVEHLVSIFGKYGLKGEEINIDDGFTGSAILAMLRDQKYECNPVRFGGKAFRSLAYGNRGTEMWFNFQRLLPFLRLLNDKVQTNQLSSRYYKQSDANAKIMLESKREAKANGHNSPDRADATVLAWAKVPPTYYQEMGVKRAASEEAERPGIIDKAIKLSVEDLTEEEIAAAVDAYRAARAAKPAPTSAEHESFIGKFGRILRGDLSMRLNTKRTDYSRFTNIGRR